MHKIKFNNNNVVYIKNKIDENLFINLKTDNYDHVFIITQKKLLHLYSDHEIFQKEYKLITLENNENIKNLNNVDKIINELIINNCTRKSLIIGFGGGVITDLVGFIASIYMRGINHIFIPTSLLGMVDASIGGKTGVNNTLGKNLIGTFKHPSIVFIDYSFLKTLDKQTLIDGFAEVLKYSLIKDENFFLKIINHFDDCINFIDIDILNDFIIKCCELKIGIVKNDPYEENERVILNFGHTIGHALESYFEYNKITHGQAVYYGIIAESFISYKLNYLAKTDFVKINQFIRKINLPAINTIDIKQLINFMQYDKKQEWNKNNFILLNKIGNCLIETDVPQNIIIESIEFMIN